MANSDRASGLQPVRMLDGSPYSGNADIFYVPSTLATHVFIGDPVRFAGSADSAGIASVTLCNATDTITGVVVGFADAASLVLGYGAASTTRYVLVAHGQDILFEIQEDSDGAALTVAEIGLNAQIIVAAGSTSTRLSGVELDSSSAATTATHGLRIRGLAQRPDNAIGANAKILVSLNDTTETPGTASDGI
jgi:hypothetical protein